MRTPNISVFLSVLLLATPAAADTIHMADGSSIADVTIVSEGLTSLEYREGRDRKVVESDQVVSVVYDKKPPLVDKADMAVTEGIYFAAIDDLNEFISGLKDGKSRKWPWSPAYAQFRLVEINEMIGELPAMVTAATALGENYPDSRFLPLATVKKAEALFDSGKSADAAKAVAELQELVTEKGLSRRWALEADLRSVMFGKASAAKRVGDLQGIVTKASPYPLVMNRAKAAIGEAHVEAKKLAEAEAVFREITKNSQADRRTLAAAYTGLGDCLFQRGANASDQAVLQDALKSYMRVVVGYKEESRYRPRAMFYAGRVFQQLEGEASEDRAQKLFKSVIREYRGSNWAKEARGFRR